MVRDEKFTPDWHAAVSDRLTSPRRPEQLIRTDRPMTSNGIEKLKALNSVKVIED